jgi:hypothetical protein
MIGNVNCKHEDPKGLGKGGKMQRGKEEFSNGLTPAQRKLPPALQKAILKKKRK